MTANFCLYALLLGLESPSPLHIQDIRKIMREHIFSNLLTKTELLIAPCWLAIASEGHVPRCILKLSWRTFSDIYNCLVMDQGQGERLRIM